MKIKLKGCPWCKGKVTIDWTRLPKGGVVYWPTGHESECPANPRVQYASEEEATGRWNKRRRIA
jgi:hypothetical protein